MCHKFRTKSKNSGNPFLLLTTTLSVCVAIFLFQSCASMQGEGEPPSTDDATPPAGYAPKYIKQNMAVPADPNSASGMSLEITRVEANQPNKIRIYAHIVDSLGNNYTGGSVGKWKPRWCLVSDSINDASRDVPYVLRETTEDVNEPQAIALVMDHSGSMGEARAMQVQNAAEQLISMKKPEDALALVKYDNSIGVEASLTTNSAELRLKLQKVGLQGYGKMTAICNGIATGIQQVANAPNVKRKVVMVFTDGQDNSSTISKDSVINLAKRAGVIVCAADFGNGVDGSFLRDIARATGGSYHHLYGTNEFDHVFEDIYHRLRNYYVIEFTPTEYGVHSVRLKLCLPKDSLTAEINFDNTPDIGAIALLNIYFDSDKTSLKSASKKAMDNIFTLLKAFPKVTIEVRGHTDSQNKTKDAEHNLKLSQQRADAVKDALVKRGIEAGKIRAIGFGDTKPVADNETDEGRAQNRRTEFIILTK